MRPSWEAFMIVSCRLQDGIAAQVGLEDTMVEDSGDVLQPPHQCRCGDYFFVDPQVLEEMSCSLSRDGRGMIAPTADNLAVSIVLPVILIL